MLYILDVLASICFALSLVSSVVLVVGWLTCTDYYYKLLNIFDDFVYVMHTLITTFFSIFTGIGYIITGNFFIAPMYINLIYWFILVLLIVLLASTSFVLDIRQYFKDKRGR